MWGIKFSSRNRFSIIVQIVFGSRHERCMPQRGEQILDHFAVYRDGLRFSRLPSLGSYSSLHHYL
jgi:hypothetical protein